MKKIIAILCLFSIMLGVPSFWDTVSYGAEFVNDISNGIEKVRGLVYEDDNTSTPDLSLNRETFRVGATGENHTLKWGIWYYSYRFYPYFSEDDISSIYPNIYLVTLRTKTLKEVQVEAIRVRIEGKDFLLLDPFEYDEWTGFDCYTWVDALATVKKSKIIYLGPASLCTVVYNFIDIDGDLDNIMNYRKVKFQETQITVLEYIEWGYGG